VPPDGTNPGFGRGLRWEFCRGHLTGRLPALRSGMSIAIDKLTRRELLELAKWAERIGMFCLAREVVQLLLKQRPAATGRPAA